MDGDSAWAASTGGRSLGAIRSRVSVSYSFHDGVSFLAGDFGERQLGSKSDQQVRNGGRWLSPAKRLLWEQEIGGSNPPRPTTWASVEEP